MQKLSFLILLCCSQSLFASLTELQQVIADGMIRLIPDEGFDIDKYKNYTLTDPERYVNKLEGTFQRDAAVFRRNFKQNTLDNLCNQMNPLAGNKLILFFIEQHLNEIDQQLFFSRVCWPSRYPSYPKIMYFEAWKERSTYLNSTPALLNLLRAARVYRCIMRELHSEIDNNDPKIMPKKMTLCRIYMHKLIPIMNHFVELAAQHAAKENLALEALKGQLTRSSLYPVKLSNL